MTKLLKCIIAAAMAGVMTMSVAVSASAANTDDCKHIVIVLQRTGYKKYAREMHEIYYTAPNGEKIKDWCNVGVDVYYRHYVCSNCNAKVYQADDEEVKTHYHPQCPTKYGQ